MILKRCTLSAALLLVALHATSCGTLQHFTEKLGVLGRKKPGEVKKEPHDMQMGVIEMVNPEQRFVLIRTDSAITVAAGSVLEAHSANGNKAKLTVTPERKMNLLSADITEGSPQVGDSIILPQAQQLTMNPAPAVPKVAPGAGSTTKVPPVSNEPVPGVPPATR